jgi:hypothetical protein
MAQAATLNLPDGLLELRDELEAEWPAYTVALRAAGVPLSLYDDLDDDQLRAKAIELGITVADDADRGTVAAAVAAKETASKPPWGDDKDFDPAKAWSLIQNLRRDNSKLKTDRDQSAAKVKEFEDAQKTEQQKAEEARLEAQHTASTATLEAARLRVALKKGLTEIQAKRLVGDTEEQLEADADELLASFTTDDDDNGGQGPTRRPTERLRTGAAPSSQPEETDPAKLAAMVPRRY